MGPRALAGATLVLLGFLAPHRGTAAEASSCGRAGSVPALVAKRLDEATLPRTLVPAGWSAGSRLRVRSVRVLEGECIDLVIGFAGDDVFLRGGLATGLDGNGEPAALRAVSPLIEAPRPASTDRGHGDHRHGDGDFGEWVTGTRTLSKQSTSGTTDYFVGAWQGEKDTTIAAFARHPGGVPSPPAPVLRSTLPVRGLSWRATGEEGAGVLGITQVASGALQLVEIDWSHGH